jgi:glycosyltransferase involved in cell wall biosynthesis
LQAGLVTTIIPVHNRASLLREAVASVLRQTYRHIEVVVINDGSTDDTAQAADQLAGEHAEYIRVLHQVNAGPGKAREAGLGLALGEFIQFLDSDDLLLPRKFELQVAGLKDYPDCGVSYGRTRFYKSGGEVRDVPWKRTGEMIPKMFPSFLESRWWGTSTPLYRRSVIDSAGPWTALRNEEDWEYDCRIAAQDTSLHYVPAFISEEREHEGERLSRGGCKHKEKLKDRASAHALILEHARRAGVATEAPEMQHFARELFLLSRQCGAAGLAAESERLFGLARSASGQVRGERWDFKLYGLLATVAGWRALGAVACYSDRLWK